MVHCILFPWKTVKSLLLFDQKKVGWLHDINTAYLQRCAFIKKLLILMFFTEVSQIK